MVSGMRCSRPCPALEALAYSAQMKSLALAHVSIFAVVTVIA